MCKRVLLIGLDAADPTLLDEAMDRGELPVLRSLRDEGTWGSAYFPPGFGSGAVWPSFSTGVSPAKHGRYFYRQVGPGRYEAAYFHARDFRARSFWDQISAAGRRVAVFDVPKMGLAEHLNGIEVVDWLAHGPVYQELRTHPAGLASKLVDRFGADPIPQCDLPGGRDAGQHAALLDVLRQRIATKGDASRHFLAQEKWDLFLTVFADPHCVGHQCWHVRDPSHPRHDATAHKQIGDPVLAVYRSIDRTIGEMLEDVDEDTLVMVVSCTGMGPNYTGNLLLDEVLRRIEGLKTTPALAGWSGLKQRAKQRLPVWVRKRGRQMSRRFEERMAHGDRERRRCFVVPHNDIAAAVRVNLMGREVHGQVRPTEVDALFESLRRDLFDLRNLETGKRVVEDVVKVADHCEGDHLSALPDFFVLWNRSAPIERVGSPKIGEVVYRHRGNRTGDHRPDSVFYARGKGVQARRIEGISIMDFAPTIASILGVELDRTDGRPIPGLSGREPELRLRASG